MLTNPQNHEIHKSVKRLILTTSLSQVISLSQYDKSVGSKK